MTEPTVQVPVSLIERIAAELEVDSRIRSAGDLRALLSQPTPTDEPVSAEQAWGEGFEAGATWPQHTASGVPVDPPRNPYEQDSATPTPPSIADMAPGTTEDAIRADEREQWASYFDNADASVGSPPLSYAMVVKYLRGPKPFGVAQGDPSTIRDVTPPEDAA